MNETSEWIFLFADHRRESLTELFDTNDHRNCLTHRSTHTFHVKRQHGAQLISVDRLRRCGHSFQTVTTTIFDANDRRCATVMSILVVERRHGPAHIIDVKRQHGSSTHGLSKLNLKVDLKRGTLFSGDVRSFRWWIIGAHRQFPSTICESPRRSSTWRANEDVNVYVVLQIVIINGAEYCFLFFFNIFTFSFSSIASTRWFKQRETTRRPKKESESKREGKREREAGVKTRMATVDDANSGRWDSGFVYVPTGRRLASIFQSSRQLSPSPAEPTLSLSPAFLLSQKRGPARPGPALFNLVSLV
ncbi:unnamed protein product [Protopolystoma xenopodis]|uniref:Uncharacterized protein n=1 Tax=Protopolystoma xenopodis TaxID=117903 RepID=A0A3S5B0T0_9PLAT|nr:unnamed protein product [Protopolystoma xenopodis]